jgi:hypothetical protein
VEEIKEWWKRRISKKETGEGEVGLIWGSLISDRSLGRFLATGSTFSFSGKFFLLVSFYFWNIITCTHNFGA